MFNWVQNLPYKNVFLACCYKLLMLAFCRLEGWTIACFGPTTYTVQSVKLFRPKGVPWRRLRVLEDCLPACTPPKQLLFSLANEIFLLCMGNPRKLFHRIFIQAEKQFYIHSNYVINLESLHFLPTLCILYGSQNKQLFSCTVLASIHEVSNKML